LREVSVYLRFELVAVEVSVELLEVEADLRSVAFEVSALKLTLIREERVMHLPELPLSARGERSLRRERGVLVEREGVMLEDDTNLISIGVQDLLESRVNS
jgi:hypothetical protein